MNSFNLKPVSPDGYWLFHYGSLELARVEANGIRIDVDYLKSALKRIEKKIKKKENKIKDGEVWQVWKKRFGLKSNLASHDQLATILFQEMEYKSDVKTATGKNKVDESTLEGLDIPFVKDYLSLFKLKKAGTTYLKGILRQTEDGFLHPVFNLHLVKTFRSSSDSPNFQNMPVRNPIVSKIVRKCFIAREGYQFGEIDFGSIEVRVAACYHKDPTMIKYIEDPSTDMHRDMAMQIFKLKEKHVDNKTHRYSAKNKFVFPQFYGDYYVSCAKHLWEDIEKLGMKGPDDEPLKEYLKYKSIYELGLCDPKEEPEANTFEHHLKKVENDFWNNRFKVYNQWKKDWWDRYQKKGMLSLLTGFEIRSILNRKEAINYPVQGAAFHCLLWSLIQLNRWLRSNKMKTMIIGQIHDSIVLDIYIPERDEVLGKAKEIMTKDILKHYSWIIVPFEVEAEISPEGTSWYDKQEVKI